MVKRKSQTKADSVAAKLQEQKLGLENLETRLSPAALTPLQQYYIAWYQALIKGNTNSGTPTVPNTGPWDTTTATGPKNLIATAPQNVKRIDLSWTAATATTGTLTLERSTDNANFSTIGTLGIKTTTFSDTSVTEGVTYYYRLKITGSSLVNTQASAKATILNAGNVTATANADKSVLVNWSDNSGVNTGYNIERSTDGVNFTKIGTVSGDVNSYKDSSTNYSTTYFYRVVEITSSGNLTATLAAQATTVAPPPPPPPPPQNNPTPDPTPTPPAVDPKLQVVFNDKGLSKIAYNGVTFYDPANGIGRAGGIMMYGDYNSAGESIPAPLSVGPVLSSSWDAQTNTLTQVYSRWTVATTFTPNGSNLDLTTKATYTYAGKPTSGVIMAPLTLVFPNVPKGFTGGTKVDVTTTGVVAIPADYGTGQLSIVGKDVDQTELVGWHGSTGSNYSYTVRYGSVGLKGDSNWQMFDNKLNAGESTTMSVSLRFSPSGTDMGVVAKDIDQKFAEANPVKLQWDDRRMIGTLFPAGSQAINRTAKNPNGWLNDGSIDVTTTAGLEAFRTKMLKYATDAVAALKAANAQGVIFWDIEGERDLSITYVGDPRMIPTLAPELEYKGLIDEFMKKFTDAGLKIGMTIRPQTLTLVNGQWFQLETGDNTKNIIDKIRYAKERWGASIFYIDSNDRDDVTSIAQAQATFPDVLLIPENPGPAMYAYSAGYRELRSGFTGTEQVTKDLYPEAFSAIWYNDATAAVKAASRQAIVDSIKAGDILLIHVWDMSPGVSLYKEAGLM